ncbi:MAG: hypothetical protein PHP51_08465 [Desulfotomaculaceae bacterium]|nr:hypothetical protein [Desulfotomaculaceae bacterium]MDD4767351.1 hypothetical protein [Desulfotomaculaceae bacterium]
MPSKKNSQSRQDKRSGNKNSDMQTYSPNCGELLKNNPPTAGEDVFEDDDFICPACCCGIYIEVREK